MDKSLDLVLKTKWQMLHVDYVNAHQEYMRYKLESDAADGQPLDPAGAANARVHLESAQLALHDFCITHFN